jgi:c-di-AMP phosphodiesterase-like protein
MQVEGRDGHVLLDQDLQGKVRFFGGNLRATFDLSKKVAKIVSQNLQTPKA